MSLLLPVLLLLLLLLLLPSSSSLAPAPTPTIVPIAVSLDGASASVGVSAVTPLSPIAVATIAAFALPAKQRVILNSTSIVTFQGAYLFADTDAKTLSSALGADLTQPVAQVEVQLLLNLVALRLILQRLSTVTSNSTKCQEMPTCASLFYDIQLLQLTPPKYAIAQGQDSSTMRILKAQSSAAFRVRVIVANATVAADCASTASRALDSSPTQLGHVAQQRRVLLPKPAPLGSDSTRQASAISIQFATFLAVEDLAILTKGTLSTAAGAAAALDGVYSDTAGVYSLMTATCKSLAKNGYVDYQGNVVPSASRFVAALAGVGANATHRQHDAEARNRNRVVRGLRGESSNGNGSGKGSGRGRRLGSPAYTEGARASLCGPSEAGPALGVVLDAVTQRVDDYTGVPQPAPVSRPTRSPFRSPSSTKPSRHPATASPTTQRPSPHPSARPTMQSHPPSPAPSDAVPTPPPTRRPRVLQPSSAPSAPVARIPSSSSSLSSSPTAKASAFFSHSPAPSAAPSPASSPTDNVRASSAGTEAAGGMSFDTIFGVATGGGLFIIIVVIVVRLRCHKGQGIDKKPATQDISKNGDGSSSGNINSDGSSGGPDHEASEPDDVPPERRSVSFDHHDVYFKSKPSFDMPPRSVSGGPTLPPLALRPIPVSAHNI